MGNTITLNLIIGIGFTVICLTFLNPILRFFGASDATIPYARSFMEVILTGNVVSHMYLGMNAVLRAASKPKIAMMATIFTVAMNILLDVIFILWWHWGIRGAAFATIISQALALCWQMKVFSDKKEMLHLKKGIYKLKTALVKNIIEIGISPFLMNVCACIIVIFVNNQLVKYGGDMAVGAYGISNAIATVFVMFVIGLNQGMQPIAGYNYGAKQIDRLMRVFKLSVIGATCIMTTGWLFSMLIPGTIARMFTTDPTLINIAKTAIHFNMFMFPIIGFQMVTTNLFQCIGKVKISIFLSLSRQLLLLLPLLAILPVFFGLNGVWMSMPGSDFMASVIAFIIVTRYIKKIKNQIKPDYGKDNH